MSRGRAYIILNIYTNTPDIWLLNYAWTPPPVERYIDESGFEESLRVRGACAFSATALRPGACALRVRRARCGLRERPMDNRVD